MRLSKFIGNNKILFKIFERNKILLKLNNIIYKVL